MPSIGTTAVKEVMITNIITVNESDTLEQVATTFDEKDINAAPVIDRSGKCVGIITSHDLVEYEAVRETMESELSHGESFNMARYGSGMEVRTPGRHFNEAGFHMTKALRTATVDQPLSQVAKGMCACHVHHVLVLDEDDKPIGMLSSLDILGFVIGEPVCRTSKCPVIYD